MMDRTPPVTQLDIARKLGVSKATVSLSLSDSPMIPKERREMIKAAAEEMGYRLNAAAAALSSRRWTSETNSFTASLAWLDVWSGPETLMENRYFNHYFQGARDCAGKHGYRLEEFAEGEIDYLRLQKILLARGIDGILLTPQPWWKTIDFQGFHWEEFCGVRTSRFPISPRFHVVSADQSGNMMLALDEIRERGYRRVGFVASVNRIGLRIWMFEGGYLMFQEQLPANERLPIYYLDRDDAASRSGFERWMIEHKPDALISSHIAMPEILESMGYRVPDDLGLATLSTLDCPSEAGIDQNSMEIGRCAVLQLLSLMHDNDRGIPEITREVMVKGKWVDGPSLPDRR